jgi:transmembrane sensor
MTDALARYRRVALRVHGRFTQAKARAAQHQVQRALARRRVAGRVSVVALALGACVIAIHQGADAWRARVPVVASRAAGPVAPVRSAVALEDGSVVDLEGTDTVVEALETTAANTDFRVVRGTAIFRVVRNPTRVFRVHAGSVTAEVVGTVFRVVRLPGEARVEVVSGKVRVTHDGQDTLLAAGSSVTVADQGVEVSAAMASPLSPSAAPRVTADSRPMATTAAANPLPWRELARAAEFERAYASLQRVGRTDVQDNPEDLLLAADVARLSRHPAEAVPHLRGVIARHRHDPRAPLSAFTLGRVLLESLGRPGEAATAFRTA